MNTKDGLFDLDPESLEKASLAINQGRTQHALDLLQNTLQTYWHAGDMRAQVHHLLGICYYKQGAYEQAIRHYIIAFYSADPDKRPGARGAIVRDMSQIFLAVADIVSADQSSMDYVHLAEAACRDSLEIFSKEETRYVALLNEADNLENQANINETLSTLKAEIAATTGFLARIVYKLHDKKRARDIFRKADQLLREANNRVYELNNRVAYMKASNCIMALRLAWRAYRCAFRQRSWLRLFQITFLYIPVFRWFFL